MASLTAESIKSTSSAVEKITDEKAALLDVDPAEERRVVRKLDYCLIPMMTMFYLLSFLVSRRKLSFIANFCADP